MFQSEHILGIVLVQVPYFDQVTFSNFQKWRATIVDFVIMNKILHSKVTAKYAFCGFRVEEGTGNKLEIVFTLFWWLQYNKLQTCIICVWFQLLLVLHEQ